MPLPVLIILHQEHSTPRRHRLRAEGPRLQAPHLPSALRRRVAQDYGQPRGGNEEEDYVKREIDWIAVPLRDEKPFLLGVEVSAVDGPR